MKKVTIFFLILLFLSFNIFVVTPLAQATDIKEGLYKASDFKLSSNNNYSIQNTSPNDSAYVMIFNENNVVQQSLRLEPKSPKYALFPLQPEYRILVVGGEGNISIS